MISNMTCHVWRLVIAITISSLLVSACANIPSHMRVTSGAAPQNADHDVRFRTTYYFRVYDYCYDAKAASKLQPVSDSLYRFVMTGKANAYGNRVRFESGTLRSSQIDPFGATIELDEETRSLRYVSQAEVQARARRNQAIEEIESLIELKQKMQLLNEASGENKIIEKSTTSALDKKINEFVSAGLSAGRITEASVNKTPEASPSCPAGSEIQRGFQIMGPQGVKTFDQDERLIMAMSSDAKPLLGALEEVSGRFLKAEEENRSSSEFLLSIVREQLRVSDMKVFVLENNDPSGDDAETLYNSIKEKLVPTSGGEQ